MPSSANTYLLGLGRQGCNFTILIIGVIPMRNVVIAMNKDTRLLKHLKWRNVFGPIQKVCGVLQAL